MGALESVFSRKIELKVTTTQAVGSFGFGGNAVEDQAAGNNNFGKSVDNFATAHNVTYSSITGLTQKNAQLNAILPVMQN